MADASSTAPAPPAQLPQRIASETPRTNRTNGDRTNITDLRPQIADEMDQEFVQCEFNEFMKTYMPFVPADAELDACISSMLEESLVTSTLQSPSFRDFNEDCLKANTEAAYFGALEHLAQKIASCPIQNRTCNYPYRDLHNDQIDCGIDGSTNKCDGYFKDASSQDLTTTSIAVPCEHKLALTRSKRCENNLQLVSANVQIMNDDIRRKFTFGLTMEGNEMTLWYLSRSHSAVSTPENYITSPKSLIKAFMSFMFATPIEMGYDPEVTLNADKSYTYKMPPKEGRTAAVFYRTERAISEYRSNNITGRMARIWLAAEVDSIDAVIEKDKPRYVLKDVWLEKDAKTELEIQSEIFTDIEKFLREKNLPPAETGLKALQATHIPLLANQEYRQHFLTIIASNVGELSKPVTNSCTRIRNLFNDVDKIPSLQASIIATKPGKSRVKTRQDSTTPRPVESIRNEDIVRHFEQRKRYRVVFEEVCEAVGDLKTLGEVVDVVKQTLIPLQLMFCAGWVHRDISSGNILAYNTANEDRKWQVKLSDLEYAKKFPPVEGRKAHVDPKTGTPYFMPHEILRGRYEHNPAALLAFQNDPNLEAEIDVDFAAEGSIKLEPISDLNPMAGRLNVIHNFQHDLESLWWLLLWTITSRVSHKDSQEYGRRIFQNTIRLSNARRDAFIDPIYQPLLAALDPLTRGFARLMDLLRQKLHVGALQRIQDGNLCRPGSYVEIHNEFQRLLGRLNTSNSWGNTELDLYSAYTRQRPIPAALPAGDPHVTSPPPPIRVSLYPTPSLRSKRGRDADEYTPSSSSEEGEGMTDNEASSTRAASKKAVRRSKRSRTGR